MHHVSIHSVYNYTSATETYTSPYAARNNEKNALGKTNCESHVFAVTCLSLHRFDNVGRHTYIDPAKEMGRESKMERAETQCEW